jgi:DNA-binding CsgD family transcriptional regulator
MDTPLDRHCMEVLHSRSVKDFSKLLALFAHQRGFRTFGATVITDHSPTLTEFQYISNAADAYRADFEDLAAASIDPVSQHCKRSSSPLVWSQSDYVQSGRGSLWEHQAQYGYCSGISLALHLPRGRHFLFGVDCERAQCCTPAGMARLSEDVHLFAAHAQAAAFDLCTPAAAASTNGSPLTSLELETLRWTMDGMTNWEIGRKLGLSERDVARRLRKSADALGCSTKYETVLRAIALGLIDCP